jgi:hypothetical protein
MAGSEVQFGLEWRTYPAELGSNVPLGCDRELCSRRLANDAPRLFSTALDEIEFLRLSNKEKGTLYFTISSPFTFPTYSLQDLERFLVRDIETLYQLWLVSWLGSGFLHSVLDLTK